MGDVYEVLGRAGTAGAETSDLSSLDAFSLRDDVEITETGRVARGTGGGVVLGDPARLLVVLVPLLLLLCLALALLLLVPLTSSSSNKKS